MKTIPFVIASIEMKAKPNLYFGAALKPFEVLELFRLNFIRKNYFHHFKEINENTLTDKFSSVIDDFQLSPSKGFWKRASSRIRKELYLKRKQININQKQWKTLNI